MAQPPSPHHFKPWITIGPFFSTEPWIPLVLASDISLTRLLPSISIAKAYVVATTLCPPPPGWLPCYPYLTPFQALLNFQDRARVQGLVSGYHTQSLPASLNSVSPIPHALTLSSHSPLLLTNPAHTKPWPFTRYVPASGMFTDPA